MGRKLLIADHDSIEELKQEYKRRIGPEDRVYRDHIQVIFLLKEEGNATRVARQTAFSRKWISEILHRYNDGGKDALGDGRHENPGAKPLLNESQQQELRYALEHEEPPGGGRWSGPKVARWMSLKLGRPVLPQVGWTWLKALGKSFRLPRPKSSDASEEEQDRFIHETLPAEIEALQDKYPDSQICLFAQDEHRVGLKPILRRAWLDKGGQDTVSTHRGFKWLWVSAFVCPETGENHWWLSSHLTGQVFSSILDDFAKTVQAGPKKKIALVIDQAGLHTGKDVHIPEHMTIIWLPSKSPELQPAERLWEIVDEAIINTLITNIKDVWDRIGRRCNQLFEQVALISARTFFHWWPSTLSEAY